MKTALKRIIPGSTGEPPPPPPSVRRKWWWGGHEGDVGGVEQGSRC